MELLYAICNKENDLLNIVLIRNGKNFPSLSIMYSRRSLS